MDSPSLQQLIIALKLFGISDNECEQITDAASDELLSEFSGKILNATASVYNDWRMEPEEILRQICEQLGTHGVRTEIGKAKGKLTLDVATSSGSAHYVWKGQKKCGFDDYVFALAITLPDSIEIYSHALLDGSDSTGFTVMSVELRRQLQDLLGVAFSAVFVKRDPKGEFVLQSDVPKKKKNWSKAYSWLTGEDPRASASFQNITREWNEYIQKGSLLVGNGESPGALIEKYARDAIKPLFFWCRENRNDEADTVLYTMALLALVGCRCDLRFSKQPGNPRLLWPRVLGHGDLIWTYFVFEAMGDEDMASTVGNLLSEPVVAEMERHPLRTLQDSWFDLAMFLHARTRGDALSRLDDLISLLEPTAWDDPDAVDRALSCHAISTGEQFVHEVERWTWPAPLYSILRRAKANQLLPKNNPFLNAVFDVSRVNMSDPTIRFLKVHETQFRQMKRDEFPMLIRPTLKEFENHLRELSKGKKKGRITNCYCGSVFLVREIESREYNSGSLTCGVCNECYFSWSGAVEYTAELIFTEPTAVR